MRFPLFEGLIYQCDSLSHGWGRTLAFFSLQSCLEFLCQHATSLSLSSCCCTVFPAAGAAVAYHLALGWGAPVRVLCIVVGKEPKQCHAFPPDDGKHCGIHRWSFPAASSRAVCLFFFILILKSRIQLNNDDLLFIWATQPLPPEDFKTISLILSEPGF